MNELERVAQMVADGRITAAEGEQLTAVLRSVQSADEELEDTRARIENLSSPADGSATASSSTPSTAPARAPLPPLEAGAAAPEAAATPRLNEPEAAATPRLDEPEAAATPRLDEPKSATPRRLDEPERAAIPHVNEPEAATTPHPKADHEPQADYAPPGTKWLRVELMAGDLDVTVDPSLSMPIATSDAGNVALEPTDDGYRLASRSGQGGLGGLLGKVRAGNFKVVLPDGYGLELAKMVGDIDLKDVPYLRGTLSAGDIDAHGLRGVDFTTLAGDVYLSLKPQPGRHQVRAKVGDIEAVLLPGSDVTVKGNVSMGDITASEPFKTERNLVSENVTGTLGTGRATLDLWVTAGSIEVRSGEEHE